MDNLTIFIAITAAAVIIQAGILIAMYLAMRQTSAKMEALAGEFQTKLMPAADVVHSMLVDLRPKIETMVENASETSILIRAQLERLDATVSDVIDRTRLQVIRADELLSRTLDRVERTTEIMQNTVVSPVRQVSGLIQGVTAGLEFLFNSKRRSREESNVPQDEMFI